MIGQDLRPVPQPPHELPAIAANYNTKMAAQANARPMSVTALAG